MEWNVVRLSSLSGVLEVPLATVRHAGGKRAQLMNSAMIAARDAFAFEEGKVYSTAPPHIHYTTLLRNETGRAHDASVMAFT